MRKSRERSLAIVLTLTFSGTRDFLSRAGGRGQLPLLSTSWPRDRLAPRPADACSARHNPTFDRVIRGSTEIDDVWGWDAASEAGLAITRVPTELHNGSYERMVAGQRPWRRRGPGRAKANC